MPVFSTMKKRIALVWILLMIFPAVAAPEEQEKVQAWIRTESGDWVFVDELACNRGKAQVGDKQVRMMAAFIRVEVKDAKLQIPLTKLERLVQTDTARHVWDVFPKDRAMLHGKIECGYFFGKNRFGAAFQAPSMSVMEVSFIQPGMAGAETTVQTEALQPVTESVETTQ